MKVIKPGIFVVDKIDGEEIIKKINRSARKCYQSEPKGPDEDLVRNIIKRGHTSVLEHVSITFDIITDLGISHEIVRHRIASYSQESTRYVKYDGDMEFIKPIELEKNSLGYDVWKNACADSEAYYKEMTINNKLSAQIARSVLNKSLKTEIRVTMNLRSLRNFFSLRCDKAAHPHMKEIAIPFLLALRDRIPVVFDDISYDKEFVEKYSINPSDYVTFYHDHVIENHIDRGINIMQFLKTLPEEKVNEISSICMIHHPITDEKWLIKYEINGDIFLCWVDGTNNSDLCLTKGEYIHRLINEYNFTSEEIFAILGIREDV